MKVIAMSLFTVVMAGLLFTWAMAPHSSIAQTGDYDSDDDGLIEIRALEQLNAVRWDLNGDGEADSEASRDAYAAAFPGAVSGMGCAESGCEGYELARDLDFDDPGSYASGVVNAKWTEGAGWLPIGIGSHSFRATFEGNEHTIANLYIKRSGRTDPGVVGLFGSMNGYISRIGLTDVDISGVEHVGGLAGDNYGQISTSYYVTGSVSGYGLIGGLVGRNNGMISTSYATGSVSGGYQVGGLAGYNSGQIIDSYATGNVAGATNGGSDHQIGGLVGYNGRGNAMIVTSYATGDVSGSDVVGGLVGTNHDGSIRASHAIGNVSGQFYVGGLVANNYGASIESSYATGNVSGNDLVGGLVGGNDNDAVIHAVYATGSVSGDENVGGLIGRRVSGVIDASYWDTQTSGQSSGVGEGSSDGVVGKTTAELQGPIGYTGIYAGWLLDFDNADGDFDDTTGVDDFWDFGTSSQYPALKADFDGDGIATWEEFGDQRGQSPAVGPTPLPVTPSPTPTIPAPTPVSWADLELTMLLSDYLGYLWYYVIVENNGPSDATGVVLTDRFPEGISPLLSMPVTGTCSGGRTVMCELGSLAVGSKTLVMILARPASSSSQNVPVNTASVGGAEADPYPANNEASR